MTTYVICSVLKRDKRCRMHSLFSVAVEHTFAHCVNLSFDSCLFYCNCNTDYSLSYTFYTGFNVLLEINLSHIARNIDKKNQNKTK